MKKLAAYSFLFPLALFSCKEQTPPVNQGQWIKGNEEEKIEIIERQFRGFDNAMIETGYRYQELYWAAQDRNWDYAKYQLEKIKVAIENGLQRRPKRAASAEHFLTVVLPGMQKIVEDKDSVNFGTNFETLTVNCNACHQKENVAYFTVKTPVERQSPIRK